MGYVEKTPVLTARLRDWEEQGVSLMAWRTLLGHLDESQHLDWERCFTDPSFAPAKKGANAYALTTEYLLRDCD